MIPNLLKQEAKHNKKQNKIQNKKRDKTKTNKKRKPQNKKHILVTWNRKIGDFVGEITKNLVTRMDGVQLVKIFWWKEKYYKVTN